MIPTELIQLLEPAFKLNTDIIEKVNSGDYYYVRSKTDHNSFFKVGDYAKKYQYSYCVELCPKDEKSYTSGYRYPRPDQLCEIFTEWLRWISIHADYGKKNNRKEKIELTDTGIQQLKEPKKKMSLSNHLIIWASIATIISTIVIILNSVIK